MSIRVELKNPHVNTASIRIRCVADGRDVSESIILAPGQSGAMRLEPGSAIHIEEHKSQPALGESTT